MLKPINQLLTVARNTFLESIRQPVVTVLLIIGILALILNVSMAAYSMDNDDKLMLDMNFSTLFVIGLLMAAFTSTGVLSQEIENKTVLTVVSKPISRTIFVLGKYLGVAWALGVTFWILMILTAMAVRFGVAQTAAFNPDWPVLTFAGLAIGLSLAIGMAGNYFYHWVFTSTFVRSLAVLLTCAYIVLSFVGKGWVFTLPFYTVKTQVFVGMILLFLGLQIITAAAIASSTRLGQVMTLGVCAGVFFIGVLSDYMFGTIADKNALADFFYRIIPNMQIFLVADALTQEFIIKSNYLLTAAAYAAGFVAAILALAVALFQTREVG
jgi:ABC-type transport system involved in multi-copper enzyme maturation permease subunit